MSFQDEIENALLAHATWKQRLNTAIVTGSSEFKASSVRMDNCCDFGKWFYSLPLALRGTSSAVTIQKLHAEFHAEAATILDLALKGKQEEALNLLNAGSHYNTISGKLYLALKQWKKLLDGGASV